MENTELAYTSAAELAGLIRQRKISPVEVVASLLERIEKLNPQINAYVTVTAELARQAAKQAEAEVLQGHHVGPLHGVPVAVKDLTPTAGIRTTYGSHIYADYVPEEDAAIVQRLKAAGAIILGKTNTPEFGIGAQTFNTLFGITRNPWDIRLTPAGSSGGSAAALAAGLTPLATGSDLGGSLRTPASFCNVVGFRPSWGLVAEYPTNLPWDNLSVSGPMARDVKDAALLLSVMAGPDKRAPISEPGHPAEYLTAVEQPDIKGWKVAWSPDLGFAPVDQEVAEICQQAAQVFANELGCKVDEASPDFSDSPHIFQVLRGARMAAAYADFLPRWREKMQANLVWNTEYGLTLSGLQVAQAEVARGKLWDRVQRFFDEYDLLLVPAAGTLPFPVEVISPPEVGGRKMENYVEWLGLTYAITLTGLPSLVVPCGFSRSGLPVGIQIVGRRLSEANLLRAASAFENARPWTDKHPDLKL